MEIALALIIAYLLGSIPTAYLVTRRLTGKDIRQMGGGNVGGLNTFREVGTLPALCVILFDVGKGVAAIAIAYWLFKVPPIPVMLAGLAAVVGHLWMPWLGFRGGKGVGVALGAVSTLFLVYGYETPLLVFLGVLAVPLILTRNVALATGLALLALPFIVMYGTHWKPPFLLAWVLFVVMGLKFLPTLLRAFRKNKGQGAKGMVFDDWRGKKSKARG